MELCVPRRWPSPCFTGLLVIVFIVLASMLVGVVVRRLCCQSRPVGHAAEEDEEVAAGDRSKDFSKKFIRIVPFAILEQEDPTSIPPTMERSPANSPEPAWSRPLPICPPPLSVPGSENPSPASSSSDPLLDFSPVLQRSLKEFSYQSLEDATGGFDSGNLLGRGASGVLYGGDVLFDDGLPKKVAIKLFHKNFIDDSKQIRDDLTQKKYFLQHRNLVTLFGYCLHDGRLFLVYDRVHYYGSLHYKLFAKKDAAAKPFLMTLAQRYSIIKDVARGLYQLHKFEAFHGAVRTCNVMLDPHGGGFRARLGDFRYSKLLVEHVTTLGSLMLYQNPPDPEQALPSLETDMLHFGGVVLEVVCGQRLSGRGHLPGRYSSLVEWVRALQRGRRLHVAVDESLKTAGDFDGAQADELLRLGLQCSHSDPKQRPTVGNVLVKLAEVAAEAKTEHKAPDNEEMNV